MRYVLLTWNPGPGNDEQYTPEQWLDAMVIPLQFGRPPAGDRWSIGTNWKVIKDGDLVCMLRQGPHGRGIVATGVVTRSPFTRRHWNADKDGDAWYVNVAWNRALDLNQMITIDELNREVPHFDWNKVFSSGRTVDGVAADELAALLGQAPASPKKTKRGGQQHSPAEHNRLVEQQAMEVVTAGYESEHYSVTDVSKENRGWDLEARRGRRTEYIEVKGTTGPLPEFFLTPNEFRAAADEKNWVAVVITEVFGKEPTWHEMSGIEVVKAAKPIQFRVAGI